ncbi:hypothetical protein [Synechocystis sp. PCC 7509]|uniref:hypothetical protein n=1 Tax=Synechocystis sp. PCC 7509 TaxID=927677 RepID=UPI00048F6EAF|nr:hypothetical protein [Synechocystis sp. PCC 7509]
MDAGITFIDNAWEYKDPAIHLKMLSYNFPFDVCQLPLNCFDANFRSFEREVLPELNKRGIAVIGMKSIGGGGESVKKVVITPVEALRYAMNLPVTTTVSRIDSSGFSGKPRCFSTGRDRRGIDGVQHPGDSHIFCVIM